MSSRQAFFMQASGQADDRRFCILHQPADAVARGLILHVHPFAEEMNKSRRMAALQSEAFARAGFLVLRVDLLGCGDSSGDFGDATWAAWIDDVLRAAAWLRARHALPTWLWGLRAGCLLAAEAAAASGSRFDCLFVQPPASGKTVLQQFLRLRTIGERLDGRDVGGSTEALRRELAAGTMVEVAGYRIGPGLASGLDAARLQAPQPSSRQLWFEVGGEAGAGPSPALQKVLDDSRARGVAIEHQRVPGPAFWQSTEIEEAPELVTACVEALLRTPEMIDA